MPAILILQNALEGPSARSFLVFVFVTVKTALFTVFFPVYPRLTLIMLPLARSEPAHY